MTAIAHPGRPPLPLWVLPLPLSVEAPAAVVGSVVAAGVAAVVAAGVAATVGLAVGLTCTISTGDLNWVYEREELGLKWRLQLGLGQKHLAKAVGNGMTIEIQIVTLQDWRVRCRHRVTVGATAGDEVRVEGDIGTRLYSPWGWGWVWGSQVLPGLEIT